MFTAFSIVLVLAAVFYAALIGFWAVGFRRVRREAETVQVPEAATLPVVSVVVAARDEEANIETCLRSILGNDYPAEAFEVIVVDDFSEDRTPAIVKRLQHEYRRVLAGSRDASTADTTSLRMVRMGDHATEAIGHKRHAIHRGIQAARGALILTTDADCIAGPRWIRSMTACFAADTGFVAGPVRYRPGKTLFGRLQALEFLALITTGAGGIGMGKPNMCNSANVAYRRDIYDRFGGLDSQDSVHPGDDEILAQRLAAETTWKVRFCARPDALIETDPVLDARAFWAQRRRWAGTGPRYPHGSLVAVIVGVYLFYVVLLAGLVAAFFVPALWPAVAGALLLKIGSETTLLYPACVHFGQRRLFRYFLLEQLVQIPYVVFVGVAAAVGSTQWKGRTVFR